MNETHLQRLLEAFQDDALNEDECRELLEWFDEDESRLFAFAEELRIGNALSVLQISESDTTAATVKASLSRGARAADVSQNVRERIEGRSRNSTNAVEVSAVLSRRGKRLWITTLAVSASLALLVMLPALIDNDSAGVVATVQNARGAQGLSPGDQLTTGQTINPAAGRIKINFRSGAKLALEGPAELQILGPNSARLSNGVATVRVPGEIKGFVLVTPHERVTDLGTSFGVDVSQDGGTSISVFEGEVELTNRQRLAGGQTVAVEPNGQSTREIPYAIDPFLDTWQVSFGIEELVGNVRVASPMERHAPGQATDNDSLLLFPEREGVVLSSGYRVDAYEPGTYRRPFRKRVVQLMQDIRVDSFLLQFNPRRDGDPLEARQFQGQLHFDRPIVGLIMQKELLDDSDRLLALPEIDFGSTFRRGLNVNDVVTLSEDRHVLKVGFNVTNGVDQIRVLLASDNNPVSQRDIE